MVFFTYISGTIVSRAEISLMGIFSHTEGAFWLFWKYLNVNANISRRLIVNKELFSILRSDRTTAMWPLDM